MIERPHFTELILKSVNLSPVPLFNRERFFLFFKRISFVFKCSSTLEMVVDHLLIFSHQIKRKSFPLIKMHQNFGETIFFLLFSIAMDLFRFFSAIDGVCLIPINIPFNGDLTIHINHAPVGLSLQAHVRSTKIHHSFLQLVFIISGRRNSNL